MIAEPRGRRVFIQVDKYMLRTRLDQLPTQRPVIVSIDALHEQLQIRSLSAAGSSYTSMAVHGGPWRSGRSGRSPVKRGL